MSELLSALMIEVPEAEPAVGELRMLLDPVASLGVPAHVTALFPFVAPWSIDTAAGRTALDGRSAKGRVTHRWRDPRAEVAAVGLELLGEV